MSISGDLGAGGTGEIGISSQCGLHAIQHIRNPGESIRTGLDGLNTRCYSVLGSRPMIGSRRIWQHPPANMPDIGIWILYENFRHCPGSQMHRSLPGTVISSRRTDSGRLVHRIRVFGRDCRSPMPSRRWHRTDSGLIALKLAVELHPLGNIAGSEKRRSGEV